MGPADVSLLGSSLTTLCAFRRHGAKMVKQKGIENSELSAVFETYPKEIKARLMFLRRRIFDVASRAKHCEPKVHHES